MDFIQELKKRKVIRVALLYGAVAWLLIQVADTIAPLMGLSETAPRLVIMLDARGHGGSSMPPVGAISDPAGDIAECLDLLELEQVFVLGHSVGAVAAAQFTAAHNERVTGLILEDPTFRDETVVPSEKMVAAFTSQMEQLQAMELAEVIEQGRIQHPTWDNSEFAAWAQAKRQVNPAILRQCNFPSWQGVLDGVRVPTLMMRGQAGDSALSTQTAKTITSRYPHIQSVVIQDAGHNIRRENFALFIERVLLFTGVEQVPTNS